MMDLSRSASRVDEEFDSEVYSPPPGKMDKNVVRKLGQHLKSERNNNSSMIHKVEKGRARSIKSSADAKKNRMVDQDDIHLSIKSNKETRLSHDTPAFSFKNNFKIRGGQKFRMKSPPGSLSSNVSEEIIYEDDEEP
jgi:hypothetical protein